MDDEEIRSQPHTGIPRPLVGLSVDELEAYKRSLQSEIARVDVELSKRRDVRSAAEALFRQSGAREGSGA